jgi:hypothetical protein
MSGATRINYELLVDDPKPYAAPWTLRMTLTSQPRYEMYEYAWEIDPSQTR